jgi:hypothetical protein
MVLRLNAPLTSETLSELNGGFADILSEGRIEQHSGPIEGENGAYTDKTRLVFHFDRRSAGRLRCLLDRINEAC